MFRNALCSLALVLVLLAPGIRAEDKDKTTIKLKQQTKGDILTVTSEESMAMEGMGLNTKTVTTLKYREEMVEKEEGKKPVKVKRVYESAEENNGDKSSTLGIQGKTVLIEKKDGKYQFSYDDGKAVDKKDIGHLKMAFGEDKNDRDDRARETMLLPTGPVAAGDSWTIDMKKVTKEIFKGDDSFAFDDAKAKGTGKLVKVYKKDGKLFGEYKIDLDIPILKMKAGTTEADLDSGSKVTISETIDGCIDGSLLTRKGDTKIDMTIIGKLKIGDQEVKLDSKVKVTQKVSEEEVKK